MGLDEVTPASNHAAVNGASVFEKPAGGNVVKYPRAETGGTGFKAKLKAELDGVRRKAEDDGGFGDFPAGPPVDLNVVAEMGCGFIADAMATGGQTYSNHLWNLTTLAATFAIDGRAQAHRMANKHPGYSQASTDALFDRKEEEKKANPKIGWPSCKAISEKGCTSCVTCPHFSKADKRSPLHLFKPLRCDPVTPRPDVAAPPRCRR
jgi:hypothetical protein